MYETKCYTCPTVITRHGRDPGGRCFCSTSCSAKYSNTLRVGKSLGKCKTCGNVISTRLSYCNSKCRLLSPTKKPKNTASERKLSRMESVSKWRRDAKIKAIEYKGGSCAVCGYSLCKSALVFHHVDPSKKDFPISSAAIHGWDKMKTELDKCVLLCANCHAEVHAGLIDVGSTGGVRSHEPSP